VLVPVALRISTQLGDGEYAGGRLVGQRQVATGAAAQTPGLPEPRIAAESLRRRRRPQPELRRATFRPVAAIQRHIRQLALGDAAQPPGGLPGGTGGEVDSPQFSGGEIEVPGLEPARCRLAEDDGSAASAAPAGGTRGKVCYVGCGRCLAHRSCPLSPSASSTAPPSLAGTRGGAAASGGSRVPDSRAASPGALGRSSQVGVLPGSLGRTPGMPRPGSGRRKIGTGARLGRLAGSRGRA
jgi:hypothetical protein